MEVLEFSNLIDARLAAKRLNIVNNACSVIDMVIHNVDVVPRDDAEESTISIDDIMVGNQNLRKIKTSVRMDVYKFFNTELTNFINRKIKNITCDYAINNKKIIGKAGRFKSYMDQYDEILHMSLTRSNYAEKAIATFTTNVLTAGKTKVVENDTEEVLTLRSGTQIGFLYVDFLNIPKNNNISYERAVLLGEQFRPCPDITLSASRANSSGENYVDKELVIATGDEFYLIDKTIYNNLAIRKIHIDEFNKLNK